MATLPNLTGVRPTPQAGQRIVRPADSGRGQAIQELAQGVGQFVDARQKEQDAQAVFAARRQLDEWERKALFDPKDGAANKRGADAFDIPQRLTEDFDKMSGQVGQSLSSERQRQAFREIADSRRGQVTSWADRHASRERESYDAGQYEADIQSFTDRAAMFPDKAPAEIATMEARTIGYMRSKGRSEEEIGQTLTKNRDKAHASVVAGFLNSENDAAAMTYFEQHKDSMSADMQVRVGQEVKERGNLIQAQRNADEYATSGVPETQAIAETRKKFQGKAEEAAVTQLRTRYAETEAARAREVKQVSTSAWSVLMEKGSMSAIPAQTMATLRSVAPEEERQMRDWLLSKAEQDKRIAEGKAAKTDWPTYLKLRDFAAKNPDQFVKEDLNKYVPYMAGAQLEQLQDMKDKLTNPTTRNEVVTTSQQISTQIDKLKLGGKSNDEKRGLFESAVQSELTLEQKRNGGKPLDYDQRQKVIDRMSMPLAVPGRIYGTNEKPAYEVRNTPAAEKAKLVIPDNDRKLIEQSLTKRGIKATDAEITRLYKKRLGIE